MSKFIKTLLILFVFFSFNHVYAFDSSQDNPEIFEAKTISVKKTENIDDEFLGISQETQMITAEIISGKDKGKIIELNNDYTMVLVGDKFFGQHYTNDGVETYYFYELNRLPSIAFFTILFLFILFLFGGIQGIRGLVSLIGSLALIIYILIPSILGGYSPILVSLLVSSAIIVIGSFITHGFNKTTLSAVVGMMITIIITGILASIAVHISHLSGYSSEEAVYLNYNVDKKIDLAGLLLSGILIGLLGILYDVAIGQAVAVEELLRANPKIKRATLYKRSIRIGREHIGALVNTLAIAYVGVSLPLLLLFSSNNTESIPFTLNREIFATEIIRTLIGSIGLILAVPITTFIAIFFLTKAKKLSNSCSSYSQ